MQADDQAGGRRYKNSLDCTMKIVKRNGVLGLYKGMYAMFLREAPGTIAWCGTYDKLKLYMTPEGSSTKELALPKRMLAGGCAGVAYWSAFYPSDVVKTRLQVDPVFNTYSFAKGFKEVYKEGGIRGLYKGWSVTALRSFPSNAVIFWTFDYVLNVLNEES
ncbi:solute carrier family 25 (mitochondrial carnitine/acylcarnitine transporter), member 20/29 [Strigomonas culicis]|nr:solute carrier family 25 (mitochondrial carnitine/acylcarnitine transporter), member 20/29 [Strigomonas culicis]|eukprot:EPY19132.1 solute carrier family 25 (mitochondrial carnitine/acylcarnitine transporter), member 20/29 [Strigomonas culicis]